MAFRNPGPGTTINSEGEGEIIVTAPEILTIVASGGGFTIELNQPSIASDFTYGGVTYKGFTERDLLDMVESGHAPGTEGNPIDGGEIVLTYSPPPPQTSESLILSLDHMAGMFETVESSGQALGFILWSYEAAALYTPFPHDDVAIIAGGGAALVVGTLAGLAADELRDTAEELRDIRDGNGGPRPGFDNQNATGLLAERDLFDDAGDVKVTNNIWESIAPMPPAPDILYPELAVV